MTLEQQLQTYRPQNEQEARDLALILDFLRHNDDAYARTNPIAHVTASAWVTNETLSQVVLVYHRLYDSWAWCGGHADGERDTLEVALRECREETGLQQVCPLSRQPISVECLTVDGHEKRGQYVSSHLHLNVTYLLQAEGGQALKVCPDENTGVAWFTPEEALRASTEPWFVERIYPKLNARLRSYRR